jgi:hypothetical protein
MPRDGRPDAKAFNKSFYYAMPQLTEAEFRRRVKGEKLNFLKRLRNLFLEKSPV